MYPCTCTIGCEIAQIQKGGSKDAELALLATADESIAGMTFADEKFNSEAIPHNRASVVISGTVSTAIIIHNMCESGVPNRGVYVYLSKKKKSTSQKYGVRRGKHSKLFSSKQEEADFDKLVEKRFFTVAKNHRAYIDENNEIYEIEGWEYWYYHSDAFEEMLDWVDEEQAKGNDVTVDDYPFDLQGRYPKTGSDAMLEFWEIENDLFESKHKGTQSLETRADRIILWIGTCIHMWDLIVTNIVKSGDNYDYNLDDAVIDYDALQVSSKFYQLYIAHFDIMQRGLDEVLLNGLWKKSYTKTNRGGGRVVVEIHLTLLYGRKRHAGSRRCKTRRINSINWCKICCLKQVSRFADLGTI